MFNTAVGASQDWQQAVHRFSFFDREDLPANRRSYNVAISACRTSWQFSFNFLPSMLAARLDPDVVTFNLLISQQRWRRALELLRCMRDFVKVTSVSLNSAISSSEKKPLAIASWQQPLQLFGGFSDATLRRDVVSYSAIVSATTALSAPWPVAVELNQMRMQSLEGNLVSTNGLMAAVRWLKPNTWKDGNVLPTFSRRCGMGRKRMPSPSTRRRTATQLRPVGAMQ